MVKMYSVKPIMTDVQADKMAGLLLDSSAVHTLFVNNADVYCAVTGKCLAKYRKRIIPANIQRLAYDNLLHAATHNDARGIATGKVDGKVIKKRIKTDGTVSKVNISHKIVKSGIVGFTDPIPRYPYCRQTMFNRHHFDNYVNAYPIIKFVSSEYSKLLPQYYAKQKVMVEKTAKEFVIPDTVFTTVTVNKNWQTAVHKDRGDFSGGFGNLTVIRNGTYTGGYFCMPKWGIGFDMCNGDLLLCDVHQWHGNTPIVYDDKKAVRLSLVMYYRERMIECGSPAQELEKVRKRKKGTKL
jgi:hypothetical protein